MGLQEINQAKRNTLKLMGKTATVVALGGTEGILTACTPSRGEKLLTNFLENDVAVGKKVDVYLGELIVHGKDLNHRNSPEIPLKGDYSNFAYQLNPDEEEIITNPLLLSGYPTDLAEPNSLWLVFFSQKQNKPICLAVSKETLDYFITRPDGQNIKQCIITEKNIGEKRIYCENIPIGLSEIRKKQSS